MSTKHIYFTEESNSKGVGWAGKEWGGQQRRGVGRMVLRQDHRAGGWRVEGPEQMRQRKRHFLAFVNVPPAHSEGPVVADITVRLMEVWAWVPGPSP